MPTFEELIEQGATIDDTPAIVQPTFEDLIAQGATLEGPQNLWESIGGGAATAASALTFNTGDEIIAALNAPISSLRYGQGLGESYDQGLEQIRGLESGFRKEQPVGALMTDIGGAFINPISTVGAITKGAGVMKNLGTMALRGGAEGALYGFGGGEGGLENRAAKAVDTGLLAAGSSAALGGLVMGGQAIAKEVAPAAKALLRKSRGARSSDYMKTAKDIYLDPQSGVGASELIDLADEPQLQTLTKKALDELEEKGVFGNDAVADKVLKRTQIEEKRLSFKIGKAISSVKTKVVPRFEKTLAFLEGGGVPANQVDKYMKEVTSLANEINEKGKGSLKYIQNQKKAAGDKWTANDGSIPAFWRAVYSDLKDTIEKHAPEVKQLNQDLQKIKVVKPILQRSLGAEESKDVVSGLIQRLRTSGGTLTGPTMIGAALGATTGSVTGPGALVGALGGAALGVASTPAGHRKIAKAMQSADPLVQSYLRNAPQILEKGPRALASQFDQVEGPAQLYIDQREEVPAGQTPNYQNSMIPAATPAPTAMPTAQPTPEAPIYEEEPPAVAKRPVSYTRADIKELIKDQPPLIRAIAKVESNFNHQAKSKAGALGLMQLMPANIKTFGISNPFDPFESISGASRLLAEELDRYKDDPRLAIAAYNAGSPAVNRAIKRAGSRDYTKVRQYLPQETKAYVPKVLAALRGA